MRKIDWAIAVTFIVMGLSCLAMSMSFADHSDSIHAILMAGFGICLWIGFPLVTLGLLYLWAKGKERKKR